MIDCDHIEARRVEEIVAYWQYDNDVPSNAVEDFARLFPDPSLAATKVANLHRGDASLGMGLDVDRAGPTGRHTISKASE
jgi:hypothetical protein